MTQPITIRTGARLHFGPLSYGRTSGRQFGGLGVMIDRPGFLLETAIAEQDEIVAAEELVDRVKSCLARWRADDAAADSPRFVRVHVRKAIPQHQGLGSGTQLALALGKALSMLAHQRARVASRNQRPRVAPRGTSRNLATRMSRGRRSAIGIHGFDLGGLLVDAGKRQADDVGALAARMDFPAEWRFVLIGPDVERSLGSHRMRPVGFDSGTPAVGLAGGREEAAFDRLPPMPPETTGRLCALALTAILPAVREAEFTPFAEALFEYGKTVGEFFAPVQGGGFASAEMGALVARLRRAGCAGIAQSSWGPTLAVVTPEEATARQLKDDLTGGSFGGRYSCRIAGPRNVGASIQTGETETSQSGEPEASAPGDVAGVEPTSRE